MRQNHSIKKEEIIRLQKNKIIKITKIIRIIQKITLNSHVKNQIKIQRKEYQISWWILSLNGNVAKESIKEYLS